MADAEHLTSPGAPSAGKGEPPWPNVPECYGHRGGDSCRQCDGSHKHLWRAWHQVPEVAPGIALVGQSSGPGLPVRCADCGARKCDDPRCFERRHHRGPHLNFDGSLREVGR